MDVVNRPLSEHLQNGITAGEAVELLRQNDCVAFPQLRSGLFPAANFDNLETDETGMANAWLRDSACIGLQLLKVGDNELAGRAASGILRCLNSIRPNLKEAIAAGDIAQHDNLRPPIRFTGQDSEPLNEWANAQNDALGYGLLFIGTAAKADVCSPNDEDLATIEDVVRYLDKVEYWQDADSGHWEELKKVNASSIGTAVSGLTAVEELVQDKQLVQQLIGKGREALGTILPNESLTPGVERDHDSALIFLVQPQNILDPEMAARVIQDAQQYLMGEHGFRRYNGDSYWGPDYREHFLVGDRAADFSQPEDMARRDSYTFPGGEAQWTIFDPMVAAYYSKQYQVTGSPEDAAQAKKFMARSLDAIIEHPKSDGTVVWRLPELFFLEKGQWVPNDHLGLLWGQANLLAGLSAYHDAFGDEPIKLEI